MALGFGAQCKVSLRGRAGMHVRYQKNRTVLNSTVREDRALCTCFTPTTWYGCGHEENKIWPGKPASVRTHLQGKCRTTNWSYASM